MMTSIWDVLVDGSPRALATVVRQLRSAPRNAGTMMAVSADGAVVGNVSAGCVDAEVHALASQVLESGEAELARFGVSDERALAAGLSCGGAIEVIVRLAPAPALVSRIVTAMRADEPVALVTVLTPGARLGRHLVVLSDGFLGTVGDSRVDKVMGEAAREVLKQQPFGNEAVTIEAVEDTILVQWSLSLPYLVVFGAVAYAESIAALAKLLGYRVTVCDARPVFATRERVPSADEVVVDWPHRYLERIGVDGRTVIISLVHDEKFEIPLLLSALRSPAAYVGALGSRNTQRRRVEALRVAGLDEDELARLHAPIGLDLGADTSEETAVSILGEVIASAHARSGRSLSDVAGSVHTRTEP